MRIALSLAFPRTATPDPVHGGIDLPNSPPRHRSSPAAHGLHSSAMAPHAPSHGAPPPHPCLRTSLHTSSQEHRSPPLTGAQAATGWRRNRSRRGGAQRRAAAGVKPWRADAGAGGGPPARDGSAAGRGGRGVEVRRRAGRGQSRCGSARAAANCHFLSMLELNAMAGWRTEARGRRKVTVGVCPSLLGEIELPLYLRGQEEIFLVATNNRGSYYEAIGGRKQLYLPQYYRFMGMRSPIRKLLEML